MKEDILRILCLQSDEITIAEKDGNYIVNLNCFALAGFAIADLFSYARLNNRTCVVTIQSIDNPKMQIIL